MIEKGASTMKKSITAYLILGVGLLALTTPQNLLAKDKLQGAWEFIEVSGTNADGDWNWDKVQPSEILFIDGYYSFMYVMGSEARMIMPEGVNRQTITEQQLHSVFDTFIANSGTYALKGKILTTHVRVALWPNFMADGSQTFKIKISGETLVMTSEGDNSKTVFKLRRLR